MNRGEEFENTFAPACKNRRLTAGEIVAGMRFGAFKYDLLPPNVRKAVDEEVKRQCKESEHISYAVFCLKKEKLLKAARDLEQRESGEEDSSMMDAEPDASAKAVLGKREKLGTSGIRSQ